MSLFSNKGKPQSRKVSPTPSGSLSRSNSANARSSDDQPDRPLYLCSPFADAALVKGNFKTIVMLPKYVDIMEWVAVNSEYEGPIDAPK